MQFKQDIQDVDRPDMLISSFNFILSGRTNIRNRHRLFDNKIFQASFLDQLQHNFNNFSVIMGTYLLDIAFQSLRFTPSIQTTGNINIHKWNIFVL